MQLRSMTLNTNTYIKLPYVKLIKYNYNVCQEKYFLYYSFRISSIMNVYSKANTKNVL